MRIIVLTAVIVGAGCEGPLVERVLYSCNPGADANGGCGDGWYCETSVPGVNNAPGICRPKSALTWAGALVADEAWVGVLNQLPDMSRAERSRIVVRANERARRDGIDVCFHLSERGTIASFDLSESEDPGPGICGW